MLLDALTQVELFVTVFTGVYSIVLVVYILLSWVRVPLSLRPIQRFLSDVCDPYLQFWRRLLPFSAGPLDFSPMIAIIAVYAAGRIVNAIIGQFH